MRPEVGLISVGPKQGTFRHPRKSVVEQVLTCKTANGVFSPDACDQAGVKARPECVKAPPLKGLFQTDNGNPKGCAPTDPHCVSFVGLAGGNLVLTTDGLARYSISADGALILRDERPNVARAGTWEYELDEGGQ
jgi:hypothetical protein